MIRCPHCGRELDGWVVQGDEDTWWRVWQWRNGTKTGRVSAWLATAAEAQAVADALNFFAPDVV